MDAMLLNLVPYGLLAFFVFFIIYGLIGYIKYVFRANRR